MASNFLHYKKNHIKISQFTRFEVLSLHCNHEEGFQKSEKIKEFIWIWGTTSRI